MQIISLASIFSTLLQIVDWFLSSLSVYFSPTLSLCSPFLNDVIQRRLRYWDCGVSTEGWLMNVGQLEWELVGETEVIGAKPSPVPLCQSQIARTLTWDRNRAAAVGNCVCSLPKALLPVKRPITPNSLTYAMTFSSTSLYHIQSIHVLIYIYIQTNAFISSKHHPQCMLMISVFEFRS
jgi:hypothetical protein